jgi:hypothetical protein
MDKLIYAFGLLLLAAYAQPSEPEILTQFFGQNGIKNKSAMYHGEMLEHYVDKPTLGEGLPGNVRYKFRKLVENNESAVYAVLLSKGQETQDWYAFLVRENKIWKLSAVRNLALPDMFFMALEQLEGNALRTKEEEWQYKNMLLTIKSDSYLKAYLKQNIVEFNNIVSLLTKGDKDQAVLRAKNLFINSVKADDRLVELNIGGIIDNSVGYFFVPPGGNPPVMNPNDYIYIEKIIEGWYIYKTT